ncbi:MAG: RNA-binding cell elongation regulator Jag/EloR [Eubacteriales bacterium]|nr:RNA-binding cell elongation regulator Jag/EloR [Eubacteriales bacterium]
MEYIEVTGKTIDEAITNACLKLEITSDMLEYEVIDKGSNGLFGIFNAKPAKIKAGKKSEKSVKETVKETEKKQVIKEEHKETAKVVTPEVKETVKESSKEAEDEVSDVKEQGEPKASLSKEEIEKRIKTFLNDMFAAMEMNVEIKIDFDSDEECVNVDLAGENMGVLIGKRGQTLDSIQYLTSLVLNKGKEKYVRIKVDTENYRERRKETLESLAKNIAYKVKRSRRSVSLEPMNPYERRIIHSALQGDKFVSTRSEGEEPFRHVVVFLDKEKSGNNKYSK